VAEARRNVLGAIAALAGGLLALAGHQLLFHPPAPASREYALTGLVTSNYSWGVAVVLLIVGMAVGYVLRTNAVAAGAGLVLVLAAATCYEIDRYPTSHNLLPFDVIGWIVMASPLAIGALLGNHLRRRVRARSPTGG
jgi:hypothetical protein